MSSEKSYPLDLARRTAPPTLNRRPGHPFYYSADQVLDCIQCYLETGSLTAARKLAIERDRERRTAGTPELYPGGHAPSISAISAWLATAEDLAARPEEEDSIESDGISRETALAIGRVASQQKRTLTELVYSAAIAGAERVSESLQASNAKDAAIATGIMVDKLDLLRGMGGGGRMSGVGVAVQVVIKGGDATI